MNPACTDRASNIHNARRLQRSTPNQKYEQNSGQEYEQDSEKKSLQKSVQEYYEKYVQKAH